MIHTVTHILPQEIDQLETLLIQLKRNSRYLEPGDYLVEVVLNLHLTDWSTSILDQKFFISKFFILEELTKSWAQTRFEISDGSILGCNDIRRRALRTSTADYVMYLDADNILSDTLLYHAKEYCNHFISQDQYAILVPEVTRMWDDTWDVLVNKDYLSSPANHDNYFSRDPYTIQSSYEVTADPIDSFKFAGWGTCVPTKLINIVDIPDSLGSYGLDDTFVMMACQMLKNKGVDIQQYVLRNEIIIENNKFRSNPYKDYITAIDRRKEFIAKAESNFSIELLKYRQ
jgi:hypothetical protein